MKRTIILGSPEYYKSETHDVNHEKAYKQWQRLKKHIESHDINVKVVPGSEKYFDSVYITDAAIIINDFAIMANYHKVSRRGEQELLAKYLKNNTGLRLRYLTKEEGVYFEGGGDTKWSHQCRHIWFGYGVGRSTLKGIEAVEKILKEEPRTPHWVHLREPLFRLAFGILLPTVAGHTFMEDVVNLLNSGEKITQEMSKEIITKYFYIQ